MKQVLIPLATSPTISLISCLLHISPRPGSSGRAPPTDLGTSLLLPSSVAPPPHSNPWNEACTVIRLNILKTSPYFAAAAAAEAAMTLHSVLLLLEQRLMAEVRRDTKAASLKKGEFVRSSQTISNEGTDTKITHR